MINGNPANSSFQMMLLRAWLYGIPAILFSLFAASILKNADLAIWMRIIGFLGVFTAMVGTLVKDFRYEQKYGLGALPKLKNILVIVAVCLWIVFALQVFHWRLEKLCSQGAIFWFVFPNLAPLRPEDKLPDPA